MKYFCTLSDNGYRRQGLALLKSLRATSSEEFTLYYLCLDNEIYKSLENEDNVQAVSLESIETLFPELVGFKESNPYNQYCWILAAAFSRYCLRVYDTIDHIVYLDSDLYFYKDIDIIYQEQDDKSVGIIRHRHNTYTSPDGEFNVGIVYFKNDEVANNCLDWWYTTMIEGTRPDLATCGDQKYLQEFPLILGDDLCILDKTFAHGAPWNLRLYVYENFRDKGNVIWGNQEQPFVFMHFSRMKCDFDKDTVDPCGGQYVDHTLGFQVFNIPVVQELYFNYYMELKNCELLSV